MGTYSIKDLEQLSGIKAHTLRVWEQRYEIISPKRTPTNIRFYDDTDLRMLLNISFLNRNGYKISRIAEMSDPEISERVMEISDSSLEASNQINALIISMVNLDQERFEKIIATNTLQFGFEHTMLSIIYPFLDRIGILWQTGNINPAHEHFISNLIRQKLIVAIDGQMPVGNPNSRRYVLFLPENELHELSLLFSAYVIKSRYNRVVYLGQSLPINTLDTVAEVYQPDYVLTIMTSNPNKRDVPAYVKELIGKFPNSKILLSGFQAVQAEAKMPKEVTVFRKLDDFIRFVDQHSDKPFPVKGGVQFQA